VEEEEEEEEEANHGGMRAEHLAPAAVRDSGGGES